MTTGRINQVSTACGPCEGSAVPRGCRGQGGRIDPQLPPPERGRAARSRKKPRAPYKSPPPPGGPRARSVSLAFRDSRAPVCATALATVRPERRPMAVKQSLLSHKTDRLRRAEARRMLGGRQPPTEAPSPWLWGSRPGDLAEAWGGPAESSGSYGTGFCSARQVKLGDFPSTFVDFGHFHFSAGYA